MTKITEILGKQELTLDEAMTLCTTVLDKEKITYDPAKLVLILQSPLASKAISYCMNEIQTNPSEYEVSITKLIAKDGRILKIKIE